MPRFKFWFFRTAALLVSGVLFSHLALAQAKFTVGHGDADSLKEAVWVNGTLPTSYSQDVELGPLGPGLFGNFGQSVATWHDTLTDVQWTVIGDPSADDQKGAAYVFSLAPGAKQWHHEARLVADDGVSLDYFGSAVAIDNYTIAVGAPGHDVSGYRSSGKAYIFNPGASPGVWKQTDYVVGASSAYALTGSSLALSGKTLMIGAPGALGSGAVWVAKPSSGGWVYWQAIVPPADVSGTYFGASLALDSGRVLVGMPYAGEARELVGAAFTYVHDENDTGIESWNFEDRLDPIDDGSATERKYFFGNTVALSGTVAVVGSPGQGAWYTFRYAGSAIKWLEQGRQSNVQGLGRIALLSGNLAIAVNNYTGTGMGTGAIYTYSDSGSSWIPGDVLNTAQVHGSLLAIFSIAMNDKSLLVGLPYADYRGTRPGGAASYLRHSSSWSNNRQSMPKVHRTSCSARQWPSPAILRSCLRRTREMRIQATAVLLASS